MASLDSATLIGDSGMFRVCQAAGRQSGGNRTKALFPLGAGQWDNSHEERGQKRLAPELGLEPSTRRHRGPSGAVAKRGAVFMMPPWRTCECGR